MAAPAMAFLTLGIQHHDLALIEREDMRSPPKKGLHHFALQVADLPTLRAMYAALLAADVPIPRAVAHIATHSFYFNDPDGHLIELFCDVVEDGLALARSRPIRHMDEFLPIDLAAKSNA